MPEVVMEQQEFRKKVLAIVRFGPATPTDGVRPAEFYQVTIDPNMVSPGGGYIRFGLYGGDEIQGWQKVSSMTVCEVLGGTTAQPLATQGYKEDPKASVTMRVVT